MTARAPQALQVLGLVAAVVGLALLTGLAWTLLLSGIATTGIGALYEARTPGR